MMKGIICLFWVVAFCGCRRSSLLMDAALAMALLTSLLGYPLMMKLSVMVCGSLSLVEVTSVFLPRFIPLRWMAWNSSSSSYLIKQIFGLLLKAHPSYFCPVYLLTSHCSPHIFIFCLKSMISPCFRGTTGIWILTSSHVHDSIPPSWYIN